MATKKAIDQLPSLPQVLVQILDAIHSDNADFQRIAEIIRQDSAMATKLLSVSNSSYYGRTKDCESIERALLFLGTDVVRTIVITASIKQFYGQFNQHHNQFLKQFWRRSLVLANFAQVLATLTSYSSPDEAYLCGLLSDVGQLIMLTDDEATYLQLLKDANSDDLLLAAERNAYNSDHAQEGAALVDSWEISNLMADAVRYHHEPSDLILDAHQLVKIINLASLLSAEGEISDLALETANTLFGLNESLTRELKTRIGNDVDALALGLGIDIQDSENDTDADRDAHLKLGERLGDLGELAQINTAFGQNFSNDGLNDASQRSLFLTLGITDSVLFLLDEKQNQLFAAAKERGQSPDSLLSELHLPLESGRCLVADSLINEKQYSSDDTDKPLSIIDRQILRHCGSDILVCWPLIQPSHKDNENVKVGVLVFACNNKQFERLKQRVDFTRGLCAQITRAIIQNKSQLNNIGESTSEGERYHQQIREAVHEASNPLSIIRNYLEMLRIKLGEDHAANDDIGLIKEEIGRVGNILLRLRDPEQDNIEDGEIEVNTVINSVTNIFINSICATNQIDLSMALDERLESIKGNPEILKQILTNLLKNATEALQAGDEINVSSEASVSFGGRDFIAINIEDNGPGIPEDIKRNLFNPVDSPKGKGHSGIGLSIVKNLIDDMNGSIVCRSSATSGTKFQILLPA